MGYSGLKTEFVVLFVGAKPLLIFSDCNHGGPGPEVSGPRPYGLLYHGGRRRRKATDRPSRSLKTTVS